MSESKRSEKKKDFNESIPDISRDLDELKENKINKAIKFHLQGNISRAAKEYKACLNEGCHDYRVYSNYATIIIGFGKSHEAELLHRKAIKLRPNLAEAHYNLANTLKAVGKLEEAEMSQRKAIELKPSFAEAYNNLGDILLELGKVEDAEIATRKAIELKPNYLDAAWNLYGLSNNIKEAEERINQCLKIDKNLLKAKLTLCALKLHQGDQLLLNDLMKTNHKDDPWVRSIQWVSTLPTLPKLYFNRLAFFDSVIQQSKQERPFYEFGVWRGASFKYLINTFKKGYGFDSFKGLPEDWYHEKKGSYSAEGAPPNIQGGTFIEGKFEDTLPKFFAESRPLASIINFDADLYSSTLCALNYSKSVIDKETILIFDEFLSNANWEQDEYKALNDFCSIHGQRYEVIAISYMTKQIAIKLENL